MNRQVLASCFGFHGTETENNQLLLLLFSVYNLIYYRYITHWGVCSRSAACRKC